MKTYKQIIELWKKGLTQREIGEKFGVTKQRISQIIIAGEGEIKFCILCKTQGTNRKYCQKCSYKMLQGRDSTRELVRIRDLHTCQDCKKVWKPYQRRFDVHHLNGLCGKLSRKYDKVKELPTMITLCHKCHFNRPEHRMKQKTNHR